MSNRDSLHHTDGLLTLEAKCTAQRDWRRRPPQVLAAVVLIGSAGSWGCRPATADVALADETATGSFVVDDAGVRHSITQQRSRIVSTLPGLTDLFVRVGGTDRLVGRTRYDIGPEVAHLTSVGGGLDPDLETLTVLEPDLVILWTDTDARSMGARIGELGIEVYSARVDGMAEFDRHARQLGQLAGLEPQVNELLRDIEQTFDDIETRIGDAPRPTVLYVIALDPPMVPGPGTFLDSLITVSGGQNVFADLEMAWPQVSLEAIVQRDPDYVVVAAQEGRQAPLIARQDGWAQVGAVREGRVIEVDPNVFNRPGPRVGEAALTLARALHPDRIPHGPF
jgi:iron complex transport system substrate-binding protein